jgi:prevent-host-death family protein
MTMAQRTIAPTNTIQDVLDAAADDDTVIVDASGTPRAAIVPIERYQHFRELDLAEKRARALKLLDEIEAEYAAQPNKLSPEEVEELADRFSREFYRDLARGGKITFERDLDQ